MEIYTGDLIRIAEEYGVKISQKIKYSGYVVEDECCNLKRQLCNLIYDRLSVAFNYLIEEEKIIYPENAQQLDKLKNKLYKTINEL